MRQSMITSRMLERAIHGHNLADECGVNPDWYLHASKQVEKLAKLFCVDTEYAAGIAAVSSSNCSVKTNLDRCFRYLLGESVEFCGRELEHYSARYSQDGDPRVRSFGRSVVTPKTEAFRLAILNQQESIVVDRHIFDAATNALSTPPSARLRNQCVIAITRVSEKLGLKNSLTQALVWYSIRKDKGHDDPFSFYSIGDYAEAQLQYS